MTFVRIASVAAIAASVLLAGGPAPASAGMTKALTCAFAKQRAAVKKTEALLACERQALRAQTAVDPACTAAAAARFAEVFAKIELRGGCMPAGDAPVIESVADLCSERLAEQLQGACTLQGDACGGPAPPCCTGLVCKGTIGQPPSCQP